MSSPWTVTVDQEWIAWLTLDLPGRKESSASGRSTTPNRGR